MKYAVALMDFNNKCNKITIVDAADPITAMIEGARIIMRAPETDEWLDSFLEDIPSADDGYRERIEKIQREFGCLCRIWLFPPLPLDW